MDAAGATANTEAAEAALAICLQQDAFLLDSSVFCALLATSKPLAVLVRVRCAGALAVRWELVARGKSEAYDAWLRKYGALVGDMELALRFKKPVKQSSVAKRPRRPHPGLQVLAHMPVSVTRLALTGDLMDQRNDNQQARALADGLRKPGMQLRSLALPKYWDERLLGVLLPALASLSDLACLSMPCPGFSFRRSGLQGGGAWAALQQLPLGLRELKLHEHVIGQTTVPHWAPLTPLTALTSLTMRSTAVAAREHPLPPSLRRLAVATFTDATPLLALTALTRLQLADGCPPAAELARLSALGGLRELAVQIGWSHEGVHLGDVCRTLAALPLVHLHATLQSRTDCLWETWRPARG